MSTPLTPAAATQLVVWGGLVLGLLLGAVGQATRFCVRGGIADWVELRQPGRAIGWVSAMAVGMVAVQLLVALGQFDATRTTAWATNFPWASYLVGGAIFGFGMILAHGCPERNLVKAGQGNLRAIVVLVVAAISAAMTLRGAFAMLRVNYLDSLGLQFKTPQDLGSLIGGGLGLSPGAVRGTLAVLALLAVASVVWKLRGRGAPSHWLGGAAVGLLVAAAFYLTGHLGFIAEHPETLEPAWLGTQSKRPEGLSFAAPLAHTLDLLTLWSDKNTVATFGVTLSLGVLIGSFISARLRGEVKLENFESPADLTGHLVGAVLMGFGGVTAIGCSVGQGVTGMAMLSAGAVLTVAGIVGGAVAAIRLRARRAGRTLPFAAAAKA